MTAGQMELCVWRLRRIETCRTVENVKVILEGDGHRRSMAKAQEASFCCCLPKDRVSRSHTMAPYSPKDPEEEQAWETLRESIREAAARGDTTFNISQNPVIVQLPEDIKMMKKSLKTLHADNNYALAKVCPRPATWASASHFVITSQLHADHGKKLLVEWLRHQGTGMEPQ